MESTDTSWWLGTVIPTGRHRMKDSKQGPPVLQHLLRPTSGGRGRWVDVVIVGCDCSDDE